MPAVGEATARGVRRVGHKGADALAPGNTPASFAAAVEAGVDAIEFDVMRMRERGLVLAHDPGDARAREPLSLGDGLDLLAAPPYVDLELDVDLKHPGIEREVVEMLRARGLVERSRAFTMHRESLASVGELAPELPRGWSVPRVRRDYTQRRWAVPAYVGSRYLRAQLPAGARAMLRAGRCELVVAHWMIVAPPLVEAVHDADGELYVWTVDERSRIERLAALGVDAVITNDPRLFAERPAPPARHGAGYSDRAAGEG